MIHRQIRLLHGGFQAEIAVYGMVSLFFALFKVGGEWSLSLSLSLSIWTHPALSCFMSQHSPRLLIRDHLYLCLGAFTVNLVQQKKLLCNAIFYHSPQT